jgi:hypothetical protein
MYSEVEKELAVQNKEMRGEPPSKRSRDLRKRIGGD